jgi:hypothetical protein
MADQTRGSPLTIPIVSALILPAWIIVLPYPFFRGTGAYDLEILMANLETL